MLGWCTALRWHETILGYVWNVGTCRLNVNGEIQVLQHENESTDVRHRGGLTCSSDEGTVMVLERRGWIILQLKLANHVMGGAGE